MAMRGESTPARQSKSLPPCRLRKRAAVTVPAGAMIEVTGGPRANDMRMVDVRSDGRKLVMFLEDVQNRGEDVTEKRARGGF